MHAPLASHFVAPTAAQVRAEVAIRRQKAAEYRATLMAERAASEWGVAMFGSLPDLHLADLESLARDAEWRLEFAERRERREAEVSA